MPNKINNLIDDIRIATLQGDYDQIKLLQPMLSDAKPNLAQLTPEQAAALKATAAQTAACLYSALLGTKAAMRRIAEIESAGSGLTTYGRDGSKATLAPTKDWHRRM